ncbi:hypothetical protein [Symmachiella dynata]|uniref:hypothetical protein n=1 Tax=Symmachiella dynata TaxID=2527995 RepID=UPI0030ECA166
MCRLLIAAWTVTVCLSAVSMASAVNPQPATESTNMARKAELAPIADPISTPGAKPVPQAPCDPKVDPTCN